MNISGSAQLEINAAHQLVVSAHFLPALRVWKPWELLIAYSMLLNASISHLIALFTLSTRLETTSTHKVSPLRTWELLIAYRMLLNASISHLIALFTLSTRLETTSTH